TAFFALAAVFFAASTAPLAVSATFSPTALAVSATTSAAVLRVSVTPLPLLIVQSSSGSSGSRAPARALNVARSRDDGAGLPRGGTGPSFPPRPPGAGGGTGPAQNLP